MKDKDIYLGQIMSKYKLDKPLDKHLRARIVDSKSLLHRKILKKTGSYSHYFALISLVFFALRKMGFTLSVAKSAVITAVASSFIIAGASYGSYKTVKHIVIPLIKQEKPLEKKSSSIKESIKHAVLKTNDKEKNPEKKFDQRIEASIEKKGMKTSQSQKSNQDIPKKIALSFKTFLAENSLQKKSSQITAYIIKELRRLMPGYNIKPLNSKSGKQAGLALIGTLEKFGNEYTINAKLIDTTSSKIVFFTSKSAMSENEISRICKQISLDLSKKLNSIKRY